MITNTDETKTVRKVAGYSVVEQTDSGATFIVTYKVGNGDATENRSTPVIHGDVTIINTDTETTGRIQVSKTFSGISELPGSFKITATWSEDKDPIELTVNDAESRSVEDLTVTRTSAAAAEGTDASYTWTIDGLPIGTTVRFAENGYSADGYIWTGTVSVNGGKAVSGTSGEAKVTSDGESVAFTNNYTPGTALPSTGGSGTLIYTAGGLALVLIAGVLLISRKKRKET